MTDIMIIKILRDALMTVLMVAAPILGAGMTVGLIVAIFQTTTSIQEQTLTFVPKLVAIFVAIILMGAWMAQTLVTYTHNLFALMNNL